MEVKTDEWGIDVSCSCSQKCLAVPPGLALLAVSREALEEVERRKDTVPTLYGDLRGWLSLVRDPAKNYYSTQPVNLIYALEEALDQLLSEGLERRIRRHRIVAEAFRSSMIAIGLKLVAESGYAADTVTSVFYPEGVDDASFRGELARSNVFIARGFGELEGKMFRIGHMGLVNANDVMATVAAIERGMKKLGHRFDYGAGCKAAQMWLEKL
jgi:alanine-glyoxylate transaminase/serine-glyoxylate transaminase/serine-pyruvate transaminase